MVAIINTGHSVRSIFNYNENKVAMGKAACIGEGNYPSDVTHMNTDLKLKLLLKQLELNENVKRGSVHISLNFDPTETQLSKEKLMEIANTYMEKIGFGSQPYLVYQHHDAGHPHIHIVSVKVKPDGKRIDMQNIGRNQSETARKEIEKVFSLIPAESKKSKAEINIVPIAISKIQYGSLETKKAISGVLNVVIPNYKFTTLGELNAVLNLYNVTVQQGDKNSRIFLHKGLTYQILNDQNKPIGVPIKASSFYFKPTLKNLETKFKYNRTARIPHLKRIKNAVDLAFLKNKITTLDGFEKLLLKDGIKAVYRKNEQGILYGITYVDHRTKCSINGSALGKPYAAAGIMEKCDISKTDMGIQNLKHNENFEKSHYPSFITERELRSIIDAVLQPEYTSNYMPHQLKGKRKKRKKKGQSDN